jgi:hypothetical protein
MKKEALHVIGAVVLGMAFVVLVALLLFTM